MSNNRVTLFGLVSTFFVAAFVFQSTADAQTYGRISGIVKDSSGAVLASASITTRNPATGEARKAQSDGTGYYVLAEVPYGTYDLSAEHAGFKTQIQKGVVLQVSADISVNFTLSAGAATEIVEVTAEAPVLQTNDDSTGSTMNNKQITELPINGRDYARFSLLAPGAVARSNYIADLSFNGAHGVHNQFSIDGVDASRVDQPYMANGFERGARLLTGSLDTVDEFKVQTGNYGAEFGRAAGGYLNIATKSGTNNFHGRVFEFFRNDILDARNYFATAQKPAFRFNDFGGNLGGPIVKGKTFFFANYEASRQRIGITGSGTVPSAALRSDVLATSPALQPVIDIMPIGQTPTSDPQIDNYAVTKSLKVREDTGSFRLDQVISANDSIFGRININDSYVNGPDFGVFPNQLGLNDFQDVPVRTTNIAIHQQHTFKNNLINDALVGMQRWASDINSKQDIPNTYIGGLTIAPGDFGDYRENATSIQFGDNMSLVKGKHTIKWGTTVYRIRVNLRHGAYHSMTYASIDDFINNSLSFAYQAPDYRDNGGRATQIGLFVQDAFQVSPTFAVDYGLRWDYETVPHDYRFATQTFDIATGQLAAPGAPYFDANKKNFGPRVGFSWQPMKKLVVRSGYGIFFQAYPVGFCCYSVPLNNVPGYVSLSPVTSPGLSYPYDSFIAGAEAPPINAAGFTKHKPDIYINQWNFSLGYQITPNTGLQVAYVGNHGVNLRRDENINLYDPISGNYPYPTFGQVSIEGNSGFSSYNGLQTSFIRKFGKGVNFDFEYTYGHVIDDVQDQTIWDGAPQDNNNLGAERGNGSGDIRHNVAFNVTYDLPFGHGQALLADKTGVAGALVGGWKMSALGILHTGIAETVYIPGNTYGNFNFTNQRPDCIPGVSPYAAHKTITNWFNPDAFAMPADGTFGNCPRNSVYGPSFKQIDFSVLKETRLTESKSLEFRAEFFNIFNHPNFDQPNSYYSTSAFGQVFNTFGRTIGLGTSRQIQLAMKFIY
jgi:Carboxypeptidase regulatory-like domain/TonB dependent receptor-like, beta-barrel